MARLGRYGSGKLHPGKPPPGILRESFPLEFFTPLDTTFDFFSLIESEHGKRHEIEAMPSCEFDYLEQIRR
jgi:hypothetical protein